jgi:hypothetical protein
MFLPSATSSQIEIMLHLGFESEQIPFGDDKQKKQRQWQEQTATRANNNKNKQRQEQTTTRTDNDKNENQIPFGMTTKKATAGTNNDENTLEHKQSGTNNGGTSKGGTSSGGDNDSGRNRQGGPTASRSGRSTCQARVL